MASIIIISVGFVIMIIVSAMSGMALYHERMPHGKVVHNGEELCVACWKCWFKSGETNPVKMRQLNGRAEKGRVFNWFVLFIDLTLL